MSSHSDIEVVRLKVSTIGRIRRIYKNLRENSDAILRIKMVNDGRIPRGLLLEGKPAIRNALKDFALAAQLDSENEKRP
jgi:serine/threonine-protein phosphatase 2B catalytic subunit